MSAPSLRPFGKAPDLDLDFAQADRPALVTHLLAGCSEGAGAGDWSGHWWAQAVGARTAALVGLAAMSEGASQFSLSARCPRPACAASFEFNLPVAGLSALVEAAPVRIEFDGAPAVTLRRPIGEDLRRWRQASLASADAARMAMLTALLVEGEVRPADARRLAEALAASDPLVDFAVDCACPACGGTAEVPIDLEALALARLARCQQALLREIHELARQYGWTEDAVLAIPPARRAHYLTLIAEDA